MNKTQIEWCKNPDGSQGYTWNPITGCLNHINGLCKGGGFPCYAYKLAHGRLSSWYLAGGIVADEGQDHENLSDPFYPRFWEEKVDEIWKLCGGRYAKAKGIFLCDMGDLFGIGVPEEWTRTILDLCRKHEQNRYYLLTKQPERLCEFSPFPGNAYIGVTATDYWRYVDACNHLTRIEASVKYISFEPLLSWDDTPAHFFKSSGISWLIIGACTGTKAEMSELVRKYPELTVMSFGKKWTLQPRIEWVREIVEAAGKAGVKVFLKNNLRPLLIPEDCPKNNYLTEDIFWASDKAKLRQEIPCLTPTQP